MSGNAEVPTPLLDRDARLDQVLADYLRKPTDRAALVAAHPDLADDLLEFFADQDRFRNAAAPLAAALAPPPAPPAQVGPYEILGEIARGGMGVVLRARHRTLGRVVALKLLLSGSFAGPEEVARFRREAEAAVRLDHPHIVPIYEVGEHGGLPYFTMKLLAGSLAQRLRAGRLLPRDAARLVADIARAAHHAHQRGVLHRDLKPANVLLDPPSPPGPLSHRGERGSKPNTNADATPVVLAPPLPLWERGPGGEGAALLADFGLARAAGASALTSTGAILGTPAYMAPEQARGKAEAVTVASDVYGLGAILYECLTGRPPFVADAPLEILRLVLETDPTPPRQVAPVPRDLDTIALKCLHKDPARRYASAADLADDLERHLGGRSIRARPLGRAARLWRAVRRQPVVSSLALALVVTAAVGFGFVLREWRRAEANLVTAGRERDAAEKAREEAEASFRQAHAAVNQFCVEFSDDLVNRPGLQAHHRKLVHAARRYYQEFVRQRGDDPRLRRELADTHARVARITSRIGERREAVAAWLEALAIYRELHAERPDDVALQFEIADTLSELSIHQDSQAAFQTSAEALETFRRFSEASPDDLDLAAGLARVLRNRGVKCVAVGRFAEGREFLEQALGRQDRLVRAHPFHGGLAGEMASTLDNLGVLFARLEQHPETLCCHLRALELRERLAKSRPDDVPRQSALAAIRHHVGIGLRDLGMHDAAREEFEASLESRRLVARGSPLVLRYQVDYALSLSNLGGIYVNEKKDDQGLNCLHQSRQLFEKLRETDDSPGLRKHLGEAWYKIAVARRMTKKGDEADALARARPLQEALVREDPDDAEHRVNLGKTLNAIGVHSFNHRDVPGSRQALRQAIESTSTLVKRAPQVRTYRRLLDDHYSTLSQIEWRAGELETSVDLARTRIALWDTEAVEFFFSACEFSRAAASLPPAKEGLRRRWLGEALDSARTAARLGYRNVKSLREHVDLAALRGEEAFTQLIADIDAGKYR